MASWAGGEEGENKKLTETLVAVDSVFGRCIDDSYVELHNHLCHKKKVLSLSEKSFTLFLSEYPLTNQNDIDFIT